MNIYIAAPLSYASRARSCAASLRFLGHVIVSTWHDSTDATADPTDPSVRARILRANVIDLASADCVIAMCDMGTPRATFTEIGWALAEGTPVVWVSRPTGEGRNIFDAHPLVYRVQSPADATAALREIDHNIRCKNEK